MTNAVRTFDEPFLSGVKSTLKWGKPVSITWDGCHKIYICLDQESHDQSEKYGYEMVPVEDKDEALNLLYEWFSNSCSLRFIQACEGKKTFHDVISQFDYDEDEEDE